MPSLISRPITNSVVERFFSVMNNTDERKKAYKSRNIEMYSIAFGKFWKPKNTIKTSNPF